MFISMLRRFTLSDFSCFVCETKFDLVNRKSDVCCISFSHQILYVRFLKRRTGPTHQISTDDLNVY